MDTIVFRKWPSFTKVLILNILFILLDKNLGGEPRDEVAAPRDEKCPYRAQASATDQSEKLKLTNPMALTGWPSRTNGLNLHLRIASFAAA